MWYIFKKKGPLILKSIQFRAKGRGADPLSEEFVSIKDGGAELAIDPNIFHDLYLRLMRCVGY